LTEGRERAGSGQLIDTTAAAGVEQELDPVEATRQRIQRLKAEGALPSGGAAVTQSISIGSGDGQGSPGDPPRLFDDPETSKRVPKKLRDVKVTTLHVAIALV